MLSRSQRTTRTVRRGFTLLEILVVVAIIVILAGVGGMMLMGQLGEAKEKLAKAHMKGVLTTAVNTYNLNNSTWPESLEALTLQQPSGGPPILEASAILDPWGNVYQYNAAGNNNQGLKPDIWTTTPEGKEIGNWPGSP